MVRRKLRLVDIPRYESLLEAIKKAWRDVKKNRYRVRDLSLASILIFTGCRLGEALNLMVEDMDYENKTVKIHQEKKGEEFERIVPIPSQLFWTIVERYLKKFPDEKRSLYSISNRQARNIIYRFGEKYLSRRYRPHSFRHSYAVFIARTTRDLEIVRRLLGHANYNWVKQYLDYTQEDLEKDLERIYSELERGY